MSRPRAFLGYVLFHLLAATAFVHAAVSVDSLRCEHLENPLGIDVTQPRLSWILESSGRDVKQSAYQILVASSERQLTHGQGDLWDSGRVESDQSIIVPYAGKSLVSREACFWKVRVWDAAGKPSAWSKPALWSMGILSADEWHAKWIGLDGVEANRAISDTSWIWYPEGAPQLGAPVETNYFRRVITIPVERKITRATIEFTGDNRCSAWLGQTDLGEQDDFKSVKWLDITKQIECGKTYVLGLVGRNEGSAPNPAGVTARLMIEFTDGEPLIIRSGDDWKVSKNAEDGWLTTGFDDAKWVSAKVLGPVGMAPWGEVNVPDDRRLPARYLRKDFSVDKTIARATVSFCGLGYSELYVNGNKIGNAVLSPAYAQYDKREYYVTYDVTGNLRNGANALGVILGNSRYFADRLTVPTTTLTFGWPKLLLNLHIEYADGSDDDVVSDGSWQLTTNGPIRANNDYDGEEYDARDEMRGWCSPGFNTEKSIGWQAVQMVSAPGGVLSAQMINPIRVTSTLKPVSVKEITPGVFVYDMGQNMVGWCRLHVSGPAGTAVTLRHAETLKPDGSLYTANLRSARVTDIYTLRGGHTETWEPRFVYHGFRYVELTGYPGKPDLNSIEGRVVNDDLPVAGHFLCSNDLINHIYTNIVWGTRGNYHSIATDCPQRDERQGWLGDRSEECKGESYLFDMDALYSKWRQDMGDAQHSDGVIPDVAPAYWPIYSDNVTWPSSAIIIPSALDRQFGDTASIGKNYAGAKLWIEHMLSLSSSNLISRDSYGDWCVPPEQPELIHSRDPARQTDKTLLATAYFYYDLCLMETYAWSLGKIDDARHWKRLAENFKTAFNDKFLSRAKGQYSNGTQTSCVLPLAFGLVPDDMKAKIFAHLVDKIENDTHGHIGTGLIGGQYLNRVLSDNGRPDLSYTIASQSDYPSWGYMVKHNATTIWELWNGDTADPGMNSGNHVMLIGDLVIWFYEYLAGIAPDTAQPGFKHIIMKPQPVGDLKFVKATHNSPFGLISSEWHRDGNKFDWRIQIPANTVATVYVPATSVDAVTAGDATPARFENDRAVFELGSGSYHFTSQL